MFRWFFLLFLVPAIGVGQKLPSKSLWQCYEVIDEAGDKHPFPAYQFAYIEKQVLYRLSIGQMINMQNGEMILRTRLDSFQLPKPPELTLLPFSKRPSQTDLLPISDAEFHLLEEKSKFVFTQIEGSDFKDQKAFEKRLFDQTFYQTTDGKAPSTDIMLHTPTSQHKLKTSFAYDSRGWESAYEIINFKGHILFKGITAPTYLVKELQEEGILLYELDNVKKPRLVQWKIYAPEEEVETTEAMPAFSPETILEEAVSDCLKALSPQQLKEQVNITSEIKKGVRVEQIQHAYDGDWLFMGNPATMEGFDKVALEELLTIDSTLCFSIKLPYGYYADRSSHPEWTIYQHEERIRTDSSLITKKSFPYNNTYLVMNELKDSKTTHHEEYYLDSRILKEKGMWKNSKKVGIWYFYDEKGKLIKTEDKG